MERYGSITTPVSVPRLIVGAMLAAGVAVLILAFTQYGLLAGLAVSAIPAALCILWVTLRNPAISMLGLFVVNYFIMTLTRYAYDLPFGMILDALIFYNFLIITLQALMRPIEWKRASSGLTVVAAIWMAYCILEIVNPESVSVAGWFSSVRSIAFYFFFIVVLTQLTMTEYKYLKYMLAVWSVLTLIAVGKACIQKFFGFNAAENYWLFVLGGRSTHIIHSGVRYFSFFSDAANFGGSMGLSMVVFSISALYYRNSWMKLYLLLVAAAASGSASFLVGRRVLAPMVKLSKASREVARGNYSITVEDPSKLEEVQTTLRNFNALVREMNRINNVTNDFVSSVSHEFKTPLTAIEGYAMLLQDTGLTQAERDEYLDKILYNTHRLSTLVGNILMLSKLENQSLSDQRSTFRLDEQLRQAVVMLEPQWEEKSLSFRAELDAVSVTACEPLLLQVWTNLIGNAIKFSEPGQELSLRLLDQTECAVVSVMDHGCGMTPEVQARIFEKFYQGDSSRKAMGNGLGLPLVKRIVELSDGVIEVDSALGQGSTFRVILPKK